MALFYEALQQGLSVMEAQRKASAAIRRQSGRSHPYYWAAYSVFVRM
jgi:CHAT domain-containing protein